MTGKIKLFLFALLFLAAACGRGDKVTIKGTFSGVEETPVYLDQIGLNATLLIDTAVTDDKGRFKFTVSLPDKNPTFYNLRCGTQTISLLLTPGEQVEIKSLGNLANNYLVEGSVGSEEVRQMNQILLLNRRSLDSLANIYFSLEPQDTAVRSALSQYNRLFIQQKRDVISFVVNNATSLSAVYALYQRMPNGEWFFSDDRDIVYFQMVADSLASRYPSSPHVISLQKDVQQMEDNVTLLGMLNTAAVSGIAFPDIELPDVFGKRTKLSSLEGDVILVDFWLSTQQESRLLNAELLDLYGEMHERGFQIYQVGLDQNKLAWVTAVQEQKLPWVSVCDFKGINSPGVRIYNITQLPANVLINRQGEIVARNVPVERLGAEVRKYL